MIYESERKMTYKEQEAYDLGYLNGKRAAICSPWVKTSDRLPTEADAGYNEEVITFYRDGETESVSCDYWEFVAKHPEYFPYWMAIPNLPKVAP